MGAAKSLRAKPQAQTPGIPKSGWARSGLAKPGSLAPRPLTEEIQAWQRGELKRTAKPNKAAA
eukprot:2154462-Alexandrium_andersonii.AAC.1